LLVFCLSSLHLDHDSAQPEPGPSRGSTGQDRKRRRVVGCYLPSHGADYLNSSLPPLAPPCILTSRPRHHCRSGWLLVPAAKSKGWAVCSIGARLVSACHVGARRLCVRALGVRSLYSSHNSTSDRNRIGRARTCGIGARVRLMPISMRAACCAQHASLYGETRRRIPLAAILHVLGKATEGTAFCMEMQRWALLRQDLAVRAWYAAGSTCQLIAFENVTVGRYTGSQNLFTAPRDRQRHVDTTIPRAESVSSAVSPVPWQWTPAGMGTVWVSRRCGGEAVVVW